MLASIPDISCAWELAKEGNGIKVYTRPVDGSNFKEYKGIMTIEASVSSLVALVDDISAYPKWIDTCIEGKALKRISPTVSYTYTVNKAPWPVANRDAVVRNVIRQDRKTLIVAIDITGVPDFVPLKAGLTRVKHIKGFWRFRPLEKGKVGIVYQVHNEPGGKLPSWLVNSVVVNQPYRTLSNMKKMVKESRYQEKKYEFIKEIIEK
jgi:ribosome-associated toxin RatA of RatAB toxin-antitoxin module